MYFGRKQSHFMLEDLGGSGLQGVGLGTSGTCNAVAEENMVCQSSPDATGRSRRRGHLHGSTPSRPPTTPQRPPVDTSHNVVVGNDATKSGSRPAPRCTVATVRQILMPAYELRCQFLLAPCFHTIAETSLRFRHHFLLADLPAYDWEPHLDCTFV